MQKRSRMLEIIFKLAPFFLSATVDEVADELASALQLAAANRAVTGSFGLHPRSRDIKIDNFSITFHGCELLQDTRLELNCGRRYGLIGLNGSGKRK